MKQTWTDLRYGFRILLRTPAVSAVAVLALALGIGANTAIFSVVYAVLLKPLPVRDAGSLAVVQYHNPGMNIPPINRGFTLYSAWRKTAGCFEGTAASWSGAAEITIDRNTEKVPYWRLSESFFPVLGVQPVMGRAFAPEDDRPGALHVALLGYDLWQRRFAGGAGAIGQTVRIDGELFTIVGIMPRGFFLDGKPADIYSPIALDPADPRKDIGITAYGRLKPGLTLAQAQSQMDAALAAIPNRWPSPWKTRVWGLRESLAREVRLSLIVLLGAVTLVLLIACANIASLLLARSSARQREVAIRAAMGAGRMRLVRQFLTESLMLGALGGGCGLLLARWAMRLVPLLENERLPNILLGTRIDGAVLAFTFGVSLLTGIVFGLAPALSSALGDVQRALAEGGRSGESRNRKRVWNVLVVSETAFALVLLIGATLLVRSFLFLRNTAPGFRVGGLVTATVNPERNRYPTVEQRNEFYRQVLERVNAVPGVMSAALASPVPLDGDFRSMSLPIEGHAFATPRDLPILWWRSVSTNYFRTMEIPLRRGRTFTGQDRPGAPAVVVINETMARRFWPGQDAVGKHLGRPGGREYYEIVGVVGDVRHQDVTKDDLLEVIFPLAQRPEVSATVIARSERPPMSLAGGITRAITSSDSTVAPPRVRELMDIAVARIATKQITVGVIAAFAALALVLAAIGIYGVLSFTVAQRTHEIGIRMALGAPRAAVLRTIVGQAAALAGIGTAAGIAGSLALSRVLSSLLFGVRPTDPWVFAGVSASLLVVAIVAAYIPAHRASRVDPVTALRHE